RVRHTNACGDQPIQRIDFSVLPGRLLFLTTEARALAHCTCLAAAAYFAAFLVLCALLETPLGHVAIDLRAANLRAGADQVDGGFLAALERAEHFVNHAIIDERL